MTMTKDLQTISNKLTKLAEQTKKLAAELGNAQKPAAKSVPKKAPAKAAKKTDTDKVLEIINRSKKGVDTATLMKKTGFNQKKVRNMLNRTFKQVKITRVAKGIYVGVK